MTPLGFVAFNGVLLAAAASDVRTMRIPNLLPVLLALGALVLAPPASWGEAGSRALVFCLVTAICLTLWVRRLLGGGDLKLLAAAGLWMPLDTVAVFATFLGLAGGVQGVGTVVWVRLQPHTQAYLAPRWRYMPYALSIAAAGLIWSIMQMQ